MASFFCGAKHAIALCVCRFAIATVFDVCRTNAVRISKPALDASRKKGLSPGRKAAVRSFLFQA